MYEKESQEDERAAVKRRIERFRAIKEALSKSFGKTIPRSMLGRDDGVFLAKLEIVTREAIEEDLKHAAINANKKKHGNAASSLDWSRVMEKALKSIDADLEPYFENLRKSTKRKAASYARRGKRIPSWL